MADKHDAPGHRSEQDKSALEETLEEFEEAETEDDASEPSREHRPQGEAGDALSPNRRRQEDAYGE